MRQRKIKTKGYDRVSFKKVGVIGAGMMEPLQMQRQE
jgi:hypothetical protein